MKQANDRTVSFWTWEIVLSIIVFAFFAGARYHTGYDHEMYVNQLMTYRYYGFFTRDMEPLFTWVTQAAAVMGIHYFFFFALWGALQLGLLYYAFNNQKHLLPWIAIMVMPLFFLHWMNSIRQSVVEVLLIAMVPLIINRKIWPYVIVVMFATLIHRSAVLLLVIYFLPSIKPTTKNMIIVAVSLVVCILLGTFPSWMMKMSSVGCILDVIGYERYQFLFQEFMDGSFRSVSWGPTRLAILAIVAICIIYAIQVANVPKKIYRYYVKCLTFMIVGYGLNAVFIRTNVFVLRPTEYLMAFLPVVAAYSLDYFYKNRMKLMVALTAFIINVPLLWDAMRGVLAPESIVPTNYYHFIPF